MQSILIKSLNQEKSRRNRAWWWKFLSQKCMNVLLPCCHWITLGWPFSSKSQCPTGRISSDRPEWWNRCLCTPKQSRMMYVKGVGMEHDDEVVGWKHLVISHSFISRLSFSTLDQQNHPKSTSSKAATVNWCPEVRTVTFARTYEHSPWNV